MRISGNPEHPDYNPVAIHAKVYLDGAPLNHCVTADEDAGTAECYMLHENGNIVTVCGELQYETLRGIVRVDLADNTLPAEFIGFDAWMRARTERAHAEYMAGHAVGGIAYGAP